MKGMWISMLVKTKKKKTSKLFCFDAHLWEEIDGSLYGSDEGVDGGGGQETESLREDLRNAAHVGAHYEETARGRLHDGHAERLRERAV